MISYLVVLSVLKKFWIPIVCIVALVSVYVYAYTNGKRSCEAKYNRIVIEYQIQHEKDIEALLRRGRELSNKVSKSLSDLQSSCILSNNPFKKECL